MNQFWLYCRLKLLGSLKSVIPLAIPPTLWGLLAFNGMLKAKSIHGKDVTPLMTTSMTIVELRFLATSILAAGLSLLILLSLRTRRQVKIGVFRTALKAYLHHHKGVVFRAAFFGGVLAIPAFFLSFDYIGVVLTNLIAGLCPVFELGFDWLRRQPWAAGKLKFLFGSRDTSSDITVNRIVELSLIILTLSVLLLMAFDTINPFAWAQKLRDKNPVLNLPAGACLAIVNAISWTLYLSATSQWPTFDPRNRNPESFTLLQFYHSHQKEDSIESTLRMQKSFTWIETLLIKLTLVQGAAFLANLAWIVTLHGIHLLVPTASSIAVAGDLVSLASNSLGDLTSLRRNLATANYTQLVSLALIVLGPSFGAYLAISYFTQKYDEKRQKLKLTVTSSTWNSLFSFLEPLVATFVGIYLLQYWLPHDSDRKYFAYPDLVFPVVAIAYLVVFLVKFYGLYVETRQRDVAAYIQKLEKVYDDVLKLNPIAGQDYRKSIVEHRPSGLKDSDFHLIERCAEMVAPDAREEFLDKLYKFKTNLREQALAALSITHRWPFYGHFAVKPNPVEQGCHLLKLDDQTPEVQLTCQKLVSTNFDISSEEIDRKFQLFLLHYHGYAHVFPLATFEWREIEKGIYLYLTGSIWFKLKRVEFWTMASSARHANFPEFQREFDALTRFFYKVDESGEGWTQIRAKLNGSRDSWRTMLRDISPHLLDTDHVVRTGKNELLGKSLNIAGDASGQTTIQTEAADKILLLLVPKEPPLEPVSSIAKFQNPIWCPNGEDPADFAASLFDELTDTLNDYGKSESRVAFKRSVLCNPYVLHYESAVS